MNNKTLSPAKAIRKFCMWCCTNRPAQVALCQTTNCPLYKYRFEKGRVKLKFIRQKCLDCSGNSTKRINYCEFKHCSLYPYRMGRNENRRGICNQENLRLKSPIKTNDISHEVNHSEQKFDGKVGVESKKNHAEFKIKQQHKLKGVQK